MGRGGNTGVRSGQQAQRASTRLLILRCSGPLPEQSKLLAGAQELNKQVCGNCYNYEYDGFVFVDELGERKRANYLTSAFPKFLESHGLRRMRFHDLRHSCASLLLANGVPLKHIQEWLGIATSPPRRISTPTWITSLKSPRHRRWRQGLFCRRAATSEAGGGRAKPKIRREKQKSALITYS